MALFWTDAWLNYVPIEQSAPALVAVVGEHAKKTRTVADADALADRSWIRDIIGPLTIRYPSWSNFWS
jgi:hypothetical protein